MGNKPENKAVFDFDDAVFRYYMDYGKAATAGEIAKYAGASETKVRKVISDSRYRSANTTVIRPVRERGYNAIIRYRRVDAYEPSLSMMREKLLERR